MEEFDAYADNYKEILDRSFKFSGDGVEYFARQKALYALRHMPADFKGRVLDFGCGVGILSQALKQCMPQAQVDGYDPASQAVDKMPLHLKQQGTFTNDLNKLNAPYDLIVAANVFHHVPKPQRAGTVQMLKGLLAATGVLMVFEHNPLNPLTRKIVRECVFDRGVILLTPGEVRSYADQAGFGSLEHSYTLFFPRFASGLRPLEDSLGWCPLGAQFAVIARRAGR